jgi:hypothetical protein
MGFIRPPLPFRIGIKQPPNREPLTSVQDKSDSEGEVSHDTILVNSISHYSESSIQRF